MSPTAARIAAVPLGLLALALRLSVTLWFIPITLRMRPLGAAIAVGLTALALAAVTPFALYVLITRSLRRRPASLRVDAHRNRFVVPARPYYAGTQAILMMWFAGGLIMIERVPNGDRMRLAESDVVGPLSVVAVTLLVAVAALFLLVSRPDVTLDPTGLTIRWLRRHTRIGWDELVPGGPPAPSGRGPRALWVLLKPPPVGGRMPVWKGLPISRLHVDPAFLAAAIQRYVEQPEHRRAIGTEDELIRLRSALAVSPVSTG